MTAGFHFHISIDQLGDSWHPPIRVEMQLPPFEQALIRRLWNAVPFFLVGQRRDARRDRGSLDSSVFRTCRPQTTRREMSPCLDRITDRPEGSGTGRAQNQIPIVGR